MRYGTGYSIYSRLRSAACSAVFWALTALWVVSFLVETLTASNEQEKSSPEAPSPTGRHLSDPRIRAEAARQLRDLHGYTGVTFPGVAVKVRSDGSKALANARVRLLSVENICKNLQYTHVKKRRSR